MSATSNRLITDDTGKRIARALELSNNEIAVLSTKSIASNGTYIAANDNADGYSEITVNISNSYSASDEGKVVSNGALIAQTARTSQITENGTYDTTANDSVTVNVPSGDAQPVQIMSQGQVSTTSNYATAYFSSPIDFSQYDALLIFLYEDQIVHTGATKEAGQFIIERNSYGNQAYFKMNITTTSISCTDYRGSYLNLYVDVYGVNI